MSYFLLSYKADIVCKMGEFESELKHFFIFKGNSLCKSYILKKDLGHKS